jgi:tetratricopeptide (TPR) repeat protein
MRVGELNCFVLLGRFDDVLRTVPRLAEHVESSGDTLTLIEARAAQARVLALRGDAKDALPYIEQMVVVARESSRAELAGAAFAAAAVVQAAIGDLGETLGLLRELESSAGFRGTPSYGVHLPSLVRVALGIGDGVLAERLAVLTPHTPLEEHALVASRAALDEAAGQVEKAALGYAEAAERWDRFGVVPERAFALLGLGRCFIALGRSDEAIDALTEARRIFADLGMAPALDETDQLVIKVSSAAS